MAGFRDAQTNTCESAIDLESLESSATEPATAIAEKWLRHAQFEAIESEAEQWKRWREEYCVEESDPAQ